MRAVAQLVLDAAVLQRDDDKLVARLGHGDLRLDAYVQHLDWLV